MSGFAPVLRRSRRVVKFHNRWLGSGMGAGTTTELASRD